MPTRKPGRPRKNEVEERISIFSKHDEQLIKEHDTWMEIDVSTPALPDQIMKIDKVDYESLKSDLVGRFFAKTSSAHSNTPVAFVHTRTKDNKFQSAPNYVHNLICKHRGFLWHRNSDMLDNRRANLENNIPLQTSTVGSKNPTTKTGSYAPKNIDVFWDYTDNEPELPQESPVVHTKPMLSSEPYDPNATHEVINLLTGKPESIETMNNETT